MSTHLGSAHIDPADDDTPALTHTKLKQLHSLMLLARSWKATTVLGPNSGNHIHSMVLTPVNFALSSYSANSTSEITRIYLRTILIRSIMCSHSERHCSRLFWICILESHQTPLAFIFQPFHWGTQFQLQNLQPSQWSRSQTQGLCMHKSHQATKYFISSSS